MWGPSDTPGVGGGGNISGLGGRDWGAGSARSGGGRPPGPELHARPSGRRLTRGSHFEPIRCDRQLIRNRVEFDEADHFCGDFGANLRYTHQVWCDFDQFWAEPGSEFDTIWAKSAGSATSTNCR